MTLGGKARGSFHALVSQQFFKTFSLSQSSYLTNAGGNAGENAVGNETIVFKVKKEQSRTPIKIPM